MSDKYSHSLLRISVAQICQNLGWNSAQNSSLEVLTDVLERYIVKIGDTCRMFTEQFGRTEANLDDLGLAFQHLGINVSELENYVHHVEPVPFAHEVIAFPAPKPSNLAFPNPRSREVLQHREEHIPDHMPYMFPNMKDEIPEEKTTSPLNGTVNGIDAPSKAELSQGSEEKEEGNAGEKRPAPISTPDLPPSKRPRLGNLPEEAGHSQYEMTCVFMGPNGVLTTRQGCQGRLPEPRMPPPNPRTLMEGANKENSGKTKDSAGDPKISINVGGIGTESLVSSKNDSKKKKSPQKRKMLHEQAAKTSSKELGKELMKKSFSSKMSVDGFGKEFGKKLASKAVMDGVGKEIGKKSVSSKAAAKFLKKLKMSKKSSKLFSKSKMKDHKMPDVLKEGGPPAKVRKLIAQANSEEGRKKKEKKSAEFVDTDEELRNLSSPSSRVPSPEQPLIIDTERGAQMKARLEAINDSINSVLRDVPVKDVKIKKRRKKEEKAEGSSVNGSSAVKTQGDGKGQEVKIKRKPGRPPKVQKPPEPPPPVDVKPFVSDRYSSEELQVYEFNDSPPDTSIPSRRPSAAETIAPSLPPPPPPPIPPTPLPIVKHEPTVPTTKHAPSSGSSSHKFHRKIEPIDDLFAPEFKIESRIDHSDHQSVKSFKPDLGKEKEKPKIKSEKKERVEPEKVPQKSKDVKADRHKDKKDKLKEEKPRPNDDKEKQKEKEHRKDKKEKKKEKEKKKKHKVRDHQRDKEKEKKPEERVKQEARESRESSPAVGVGVKLKIKIGGGAGTPTSMMVTGEGSAPASPAPNLGSKRESMSPPRVVPKIYISKKGQGTEEKPKKNSKSSSQHGEGSKRKPSALAMSSKSQPASQSASPSSSKTSPSPRSTPTPPVPRKTPTPPPNPKAAHKGHHSPSPHTKVNSSKQKDGTSLIPTKERQSRSLVKDRSSKVEKKKKERKASLSSLSSASSSSPSPPAKASLSKRQTPPRLERMSTSPEKSPPPLPFQSPTPSPQPPSSAARSPSHTSSPHHSPTPPPSLSRRKLTPPPALSPREEYHSPSPARPPTPGSTSPPPSPEWNLPVSSPSHPRSPTPTPRTPTASPSRNIPSPHSTPPGSPMISHRSPSPAISSRPGSRLMDTPEPKPQPKDNPSPASSGKSSTSVSKPARTVEAETVCVFYDDSGQKVWICPACKLPDDGSEMIGCDMCDNWYHWPCVGITEAPPEEQQWFCCKCLPKTKSSIRGRGRPRGRGRGRGRKKIT